MTFSIPGKKVRNLWVHKTSKGSGSVRKLAEKQNDRVRKTFLFVSQFSQIPISFKMSISDIFSITLQNTKKEKETSKQSWDMLAPFILSLNQISEEKLKHFSRYLNLPFTMGRKFPHGRSHLVSLSLH